jgi:hypothetical protein
MVIGIHKIWIILFSIKSALPLSQVWSSQSKTNSYDLFFLRVHLCFFVTLCETAITQRSSENHKVSQSDFNLYIRTALPISSLFVEQDDDGIVIDRDVKF